MVHEALRRHNYRGVPIREIAERLAQRLRNAWDIAARVALDIEGNADNISEKRGFALALILNELLTNAFRHGFADGRQGKVVIRILRVDDTLRIEVEDNGMGSTAVSRPNVVGSGRSIVAALVNDELGGSVDYHSDEHGTRVRLEFPVES
jgi:two-component sensor histidine kinase